MILLILLVCALTNLIYAESENSGTRLSQQNDYFLKRIHRIGNVYSYNETYDIDLITNDKINYTKIRMLSTISKVQLESEYVRGFHFDDTMGYTIERTFGSCFYRCLSMLDNGCVGANYIEHVKWCILTRSYADEGNIGGSGGFYQQWMASSFFYFRGIARPPRDYSESKEGILPSKLGEPFFRPHGFEKRNSRIIGGRESKPFSLPWLVEIGGCTAVLIAQNPGSDAVGDWSDKILTAAHCVKSFSSENCVVKLGTHRQDVIELHEVHLRVKSAIIHEEYDREKLINDIALIKLEKPVKFSEYIRPAALPRDDSAQEDIFTLNCLAAGWGENSEHEPSVVLSQLPREIIECNTTSQPDLAICMKWNKTSSVGYGDSGGPLSCYNRTSDQFITYGILSTFDYYSDTRKLKPWIIRAASALDNNDFYLPKLTSFHRPTNVPFDDHAITHVTRIVNAISSIYNYPDTNQLTEIIDKMVFHEPIRITSTFGVRDGFHLDHIIGFTLEKSIYHCIAQCEAMTNCTACNYVKKAALCVLLQSAMIDNNRTLWFDKNLPSVHIYFTGPIKIAIQPKYEVTASAMTAEPGKPNIKISETNFIDVSSTPLNILFGAGFKTNESEFTRCTASASFEEPTPGQLQLFISTLCDARWNIGDPVIIPTINGKYTLYLIKNNQSTPDEQQTNRLSLEKPSNLQFQSIELPVIEQAFKQIVPNIQIEPHSQPWLVELTSYNDFQEAKRCIGIILAENSENASKSTFVLTTRSCVSNGYGDLLRPVDITIKFGSHLTGDVIEKHELERNVKQIIAYQNGPVDKHGNRGESVALIVLAEPVVFTKYVAPIEVIAEDDLFEPTCYECFVAGWLSERDDCKYEGPSLSKTYIKAEHTLDTCQTNHATVYPNVTVKMPYPSHFLDTWLAKPCGVRDGSPLICFDPMNQKYFVKKIVDKYEVTSKFGQPKITYVPMSGVVAWMKKEMDDNKRRFNDL